MNQKNIAHTIVITAAALTTFLSASYAAEPKLLSKSQAAQLLVSMGYQDVEVGAIVHGFAPMTGSQNVATVLAVGRRNGTIQKLERHLLYDADIGWFYYEYDDSGTGGLDYKPPTKLQIWTLSGYKEFRPKQTEGADKEAPPDTTEKSSRECLSNLKVIGLAARMWSTDHGQKFPKDFKDIKEELQNPKVLVCPSDGQRRSKALKDWSEVTAQAVSYEMVPGADELKPETVFARCLTHKYVVYADGTVSKTERK